jgi:hypothetical protein
MSDTSDPFASADPETRAYIDARLAEVGGSGTTSSLLDTVWGNSISNNTVVETRGGGGLRKAPKSSPWKPRGPYIDPGQDYTASQIFNEVYNLSNADPEDWQRIQQQLYLGGFYGNRDLDELNFGQIDEDDVNAISQVLTWTARHNAADKERGGKGTTSWRDILSGYAKEMLGPRMEQLAKAASAPKVTLADPKGLASALDDVARNVLGRKANAEEKRLFVATYHAMQSGAQSATSGTVVSPDAQGQAEAQLRGANPAEAGAHDLSNTFNDFLQIISGGFG